MRKSCKYQKMYLSLQLIIRVSMNGNHIKWLPQEGKCRKESESGILENSSNPSWRSLEKIKIVAGTTVSQPREKTKWFIVDITTNIIKGWQKRKWSRWPIGSSIRFRTKRAWVSSSACGNNGLQGSPNCKTKRMGHSQPLLDRQDYPWHVFWPWFRKWSLCFIG